MGEIKSVKVDNWGVFFLQKLQNFFNKTDYCDLTLQFRDNSQLKVHRLVLSACTDFFNVLEQTCETVDEALIMPIELQADVVVPIVNFMYTGTLEFELKMYGKLLRTAKEMNMTVLLKLLEAHRRTMEGVHRANRPPSPKSVRRRPTAPSVVGSNSQQQVSPQRRALTSPNAGLQPIRRITQTKTMTTNTGPSTSTVSPQQVQYRQQIGATSLIKTSVGGNARNVGSVQVRGEYSNITYFDSNQTAVKQEPDEQMPTSPFEQLRKGYNNNKRPATSTFMSPPSKKLNIEDVKEFAEQQRMRKQIAAEYGEDHGEYDNSIMDDDIHNDDDDDEVAAPTTSSSANNGLASTAKVTQLQHGATTITINQNEKPPTIVVKDNSNSKINHAKIIKEVLRQYPHLVKSNRNIKLKIVPNTNEQSQKITVKKEQTENIIAPRIGGIGSQQQTIVHRTPISQQTLLKPAEKPLTNNQQQTQQPVSTKISIQQNEGGVQASTTEVPPQKRRIDSKTMHALIAQGAENTTGPWLCLRCGVNGRPISIPSYRGFRRHLINTHKETIDPALCEHCGWRSSNVRELHYHMEVEHKIKTTSYSFPECLLCDEIFLNTFTLNQHRVDVHPGETKQQCIYCNKVFAREIQLYTHIKAYHKKEALEDGIIDYSDEEFPGPQNELGRAEAVAGSQNLEPKEKKDTKIKILSDISLPIAGSILKLESGSDISKNIGLRNSQEFLEPHETTAVATTKFVSVDGNEMLLTDEQRKQIMSQLNEEPSSGGVVMVLNESGEFTAGPATHNAPLDGKNIVEKVSETGAADTAEEGSTNEEDLDDSQIFNEFNNQNNNSGTDEARVMGDSDSMEEESIEEKKNASGTLDESKESVENLEWAENLISAQELADEALEVSKETQKKDDDINQKLKELTGDWSDDENEDEMEQPEDQPTGNSEPKETIKKGSEPTLIEPKGEIKSSKEILDIKEELQSVIEHEEKMETDDDLEEKNAADSFEADKITSVEDSKDDADHVDVLMKSLHKEDSCDAVKTDEDNMVEEQFDASEKNPSENIKIRSDLMSQQEKPKEKDSKNKPVEEESSDTEKEYQRKSATEIVQGENLLDELIGKSDEEEFIAERTANEALKSSDGISRAMVLDNKESEKNSKTAEADNSAETSTTGTEDKIGNISEMKADKTETTDTVKNLISEWGDDEDEADL